MRSLLPVAIVAAALVGSYVVQPAETALDVRVVGIASAVVKVVKPGETRVVARGAVGDGGRVRLGVDPGRYQVDVDEPRGDSVRSVRVRVREDEVVSVTLRRRR